MTPCTAAGQASLSFTNSWSLFKYMSIKSVMRSNHLILCHCLLCLPSTFPSIRVFSSKSVLCIRWPEFWSFSFSISPSNEYWTSLVAQMVKCQSTMRERVGKIPWRRKWQSTPGLLPGKSHGQRSLVGYSPWGRKDLDMTERLHFHFQ